MQDLPVVVLRQIAELLPPTDLFNLALTCRRLLYCLSGLPLSSNLRVSVSDCHSRALYSKNETSLVLCQCPQHGSIYIMDDILPLLFKEMSKRAVSFDDSVSTKTYDSSTSELLKASAAEYDLPESDERNADGENEDGEPEKKKKHTLDSDEEEEDDHKQLDMKKVEGQEDCEVDFDGNTKITAFNMKEDMEDGHFDQDANFVFDKKEKDIHDAWLDDIDWSTVKKKAGEQWEKEQKDESDLLPEMTNERRREIYVLLLKILMPGQTVLKALTELKKKKGLSAAEERKLRWAAKKEGKKFEDMVGEDNTNELRGLADELLTSGNMDAYEWTRERIDHLLQTIDKESAAANTAADDVDMFSDEVPTTSELSEAVSANDSLSSLPIPDEVLWEYKEDIESEVQGPFTSSEMAERKDNGKLTPKGLARKKGTGSFNPVARIDFDIYC